MPQQKVSIPIPEDLKPAQRKELADLVIEHIYERTTEENVDKRGRPFPEYSESYMKSLDFANAGKSGKVDLQLSGDMLAAMRLLRESRGEIVIGFDRGSPENAKAEGNILGSYGGEPNRKRARDFLGIEPAKLRELIRFIKNGDK